MKKTLKTCFFVFFVKLENDFSKKQNNRSPPPLRYHTEIVSSRGREEDSCWTGLEGLGDSLDDWIPNFAAEGGNISLVEGVFPSLYSYVLC